MNTKLLLSALLIVFTLGTASAQKYKNIDAAPITSTFKGSTFTSEKSFAENMETASSFSYLTTMLKDESLAALLNSEEMITVFAPIDVTFSELPETTRDSIIGNAQLVQDMVRLHTIPARVDINSIKSGIERGNGVIYYTTLSNEKIGFKMVNDQVVLFDTENNTAIITAGDFLHKNGFFHVVEGLVFPASEDN